MTAVEWFNKQLVDRQNENGNLKSLDELFKEAKEMEKEQIINAFGVGCQVESTRLIGYQDLAEQYYNETFKTNNK